MYKHLKRILIVIMMIVAGSTAINISSSMDISSGRVKVNTGLPIVTIYTNLNSEGNRINITKDDWTAAHIEITDGNTGYTFTSKMSIKGRGHSSWSMPKKGYSVEFSDKESILGMPLGKNWALVASYADKTLMRNSIAYDFARAVQEGYVPSYRYVELYLNDKFLGNYLFLEKIEVDENRLNINKLNQDDKLNSDISGGYLIEVDMRARVSEGKDKFFTSEYINEDHELFIDEDGEKLPIVFSVRSPSPKKITQNQFEYIKNYILEAERSLFSEDFTDPEEGYAKYFDVESFVDWYVINELFKSVDAPMLTSVYLHKDVNGKLTMGPVWDFDLSMGLAGLRYGNEYEGVYVGKSPWFARLLEDPVFVEKVLEKWTQIRDTYVEGIFQNIDSKYEYLKRSQKENFKVWNIIGRYVWPEPQDMKPRKSYDEEVLYLKEWLYKRIQWFDETYGLNKDMDIAVDTDVVDDDINYSTEENNIISE